MEGLGVAGVHSEGGVWATLWGLLMWDALFADVADSLRTPFQTCPLDLSCPTFYMVHPAHFHQRMHNPALACHAMQQLEMEDS